MNASTGIQELSPVPTSDNTLHPNQSLDIYGNGWFYNTTTNPHPSVHVYYDAWGYKLRVYSLCICTVIGLIGNPLAFVVFIKSNIKSTSVGIYLMSLAWADSGYLVLETLIRWNSLAFGHRICSVAWYLRSVFRLQEAFLVVAISTDRTLNILAPFRSVKCSNAKCAWTAVLCLTAASLLLSSYHLTCTIQYGRGCNRVVNDPDNICKLAYFAITMVTEEFLTSLVVIAMAVYIVRELASLQKRAQRLSQNRPPVAPSIDRDVTRMTIAVAIVFSSFRLPCSMVYIPFYVRHMFYRVPYLENVQVHLAAAIEVFSVPYNMNYCVNFIIYVVFWTAFRKKLWQILRQCARRSRTDSIRSLRGNSYYSTSATQV